MLSANRNRSTFGLADAYACSLLVSLRLDDVSLLYGLRLLLLDMVKFFVSDVKLLLHLRQLLRLFC